eukprot:COSAG04_NODE_6838_length_1244_cov_2.807860_2_plen_187_part_00
MMEQQPAEARRSGLRRCRVPGRRPAAGLLQSLQRLMIRILSSQRQPARSRAPDGFVVCCPEHRSHPPDRHARSTTACGLPRPGTNAPGSGEPEACLCCEAERQAAGAGLCEGQLSSTSALCPASGGRRSGRPPRPPSPRRAVEPLRQQEVVVLEWGCSSITKQTVPAWRVVERDRDGDAGVEAGEG